jgi:intraflagellar transport protein 74
VNNNIRELSKHGIETSHITGKSTGPGRQYYDKTFFQNLFKQKINDINKEVNNLKGEVETINKDVNEYYQLNKTYEGLSKEVQNLEGELADYNLAGDKYRSNMRAEDIDAVFFHIKSNNKKKRDRSDEMFLEKARKEEELQSVEFEINQIMQKLEQRLMDLEPDQQIEYEQIREENSHLVKKIHELRDEMTRLNVDIVEGEKFLKNNPNKKEAHKLNDQIIQLNRKKELLQLQLNDSGLSLEEWKEKLVKQYKQDLEEKAQIDKKIGEIKKVIDSYKKSISELEKEFDNNTNNSVENSKAQDSIMQKDREYSKFIENFDEIKRGVKII